MRELLWVQLGFDLAMLFALLALERSTARRRRVPLPRRGPREAVAEAALRQRLARFRESTG